MENEEKALIKEAQRGNILAFERLVKRYDRQVMQMAYNMLNNVHDAEDVYQEIFVRVFKNLHRFQFRSAFSTWLYRVVVNTCINHQKMRRKRQHYSLNNTHEESRESWHATLKGEEISPEDSVLNQELSQEITAAVEQLSEKQKAVFILRHYHGRKLKDIAGILNCTEGTVKNYLFRATQKMQKLLQEYSKT